MSKSRKPAKAASTGDLKIPKPEFLSVAEAAAFIPRKESKYAVILDAMRQLKPDGVAKFDFPKTVDVRKIINNLISATQNAGVLAPDGYSFFKKVGTNNELVISVLERRKRRRASAK